MDKNRSDRQAGSISVRRMHLIMMAVAFLFAILLLYATNSVMTGYRILQNATDQYIELQQDTQDMMAASDYLTDRVRCFVVTGNKQYVDDFFEEVNETRRRDAALESMETVLAGTETYRYLEEALWYSNNLLNIEHYAMRLAAEVYGLDVSGFPEEIQNVTIWPRHAWLNTESKRNVAIDLVFNSEYEKYKKNIRRDVDLCSEALVQNAKESQQESSAHLLAVIRRLTACIILLLLSVLFMVILTAKLIIDPLYNGIQHIKKKELFPVAGSSEMRYLAKTYNDLYESSRREQETLSYEASHDALTGLSNRAMFEKVRKECDPQSTAMILIDIDFFKEVNDTYGHEAGDQLLKRAAKVFRSSFRSEDCVCRIGGDEFAVLMMNSGSHLRALVQRKIETAQARLRDEENGVPGVTISVGVAFPDRPNPTDDIYQDADTALYKVKNAGRNGLAFYE